MSEIKKISLPVKGMHCRSCEMLIENKIKELPGVKRVTVDYKRNLAEIYYDEVKPSTEAVALAITKAGYSLGVEEKSGWFSKNKTDYLDLGLAALILLGIYLIAKAFGFSSSSILPTSESGVSIPLILLIGLAAGFSSCMALVGGLVLGLSLKHNELYPEATVSEKFRPHLFFNLGRVATYTFLGGLLGILGSTIQLSNFTLGSLTIAVGLVMLLLGLQLIEIFPRARKFKLTLPKGLSRLLGIGENQKEYSAKNSFILGGLTFFLPCGFTQAMQVLAVSTTSFLAGAFVMGLFAIGTMPGLLSIGGLASIIKGNLAKKFFKFSGLAIIIFAIFNLNNGLNLVGFNFAYSQAPNNSINATDPNVVLENGQQVVKMTETSSGYSPNSFTIKKGVLVKWVIDAQAPYSCAASLIMPKYNIRKNLVKGENIIEFTPTQAGRIPFSCSMGMYTGSFNVIE